MLSNLESQSPKHSSPTVSSVSLPRHYQTAASLLSQARTYQREGSPEFAYVMYRRFVVYNLQTLHKHPQYSLSRWAVQRADYRSLCAEAMDQLECIREEIVAKYAHSGEERKEQQEEEEDSAAEDAYERQQPPLSAASSAADAALEARLSALVMEEQQQAEQEKQQDSTYTEQLPTTPNV